MITLSKLANFLDDLSENDELREYELSGSGCNVFTTSVMVLHCKKI